MVQGEQRHEQFADHVTRGRADALVLEGRRGCWGRLAGSGITLLCRPASLPVGHDVCLHVPRGQGNNCRYLIDDGKPCLRNIAAAEITFHFSAFAEATSREMRYGDIGSRIM